MLVVLVVSAVLMGALLPASTAIGGVSPASVAIVLVWLAGVYVLDRVWNKPRWRVSMPGGRPGRRHRREPHSEQPHPFASSSNELANRAGINGVIFGATVLAIATALPEISSGIAAARLGDNALAVSDVFGGNAFQVSLFLLADVTAGAPVLPSAGTLNSWLAALGIALTAVYAIGVVARPARCRFRLGPDSIVALVLFSLGIAGLFLVPH